jgi:DMSO/TMAO reductase YedYZ molybdopterin-dependent catalytic subunit
MRRRTRRDFLVAGLAAAAGVGGYEWVRHAKDADGVPWPQRAVMDLNGRIAKAYVSDSHLMPSYSGSQISPLKPNGDVGLNPEWNPSSWRLGVAHGDAEPALHLRLTDLALLPKVNMITRFCCIEGWSAIVAWGGFKFSDFTRKFYPRGAELSKYVSLSTPDEDYYVGLDMKSALHPQTLLAIERNFEPLDSDHGAPLRLVIPVKYGIKNIKRIGTIRYTNERPDDYWAQEGYDWFAGL